MIRLYSPRGSWRSAAMPPAKQLLVPYDPKIVTGYHGTTKERGARAVSEQTIHPSKNAYDWLGHGTYFWEDSYSRARQWAEQKYHAEAAVVRGQIRLGHCVNLLDTNWAPGVKAAYDRVVSRHAADGQKTPENRGGYRVLDCLVMNELTGDMVKADTVRAAFIEGEPVYPTSLFVGLAHIQLVVVNLGAIVSPLEICEMEK